ncbi:MAG: hypothetical protein ACI4XP_09530 [Acutalibacteraceae bacterium]
MKKTFKLLTLLLLVCSIVLSVPLSVSAATTTSSSNQVTFTNYKKGTKSIVKFGINNNNYIECFGGAVITYNYKPANNNSASEYRKIFYLYDKYGNVYAKEYKNANAKSTDSNYSAIKHSNKFDLQSILNKTKNGGSLVINFYNKADKSANKMFFSYGSFRIFKNTTLNSPDKTATIQKRTDYVNRFLFINTDDAASKTLSDKYAGDGNISIKNIKFDMKKGNSEIGKFLHASKINIENCTFQNGMFDCHVFELSCVKDSKVTGCKFSDFLYVYGIDDGMKNDSSIKKGHVLSPSSFKNLLNKSENYAKHELIQVESTEKGASPYGLYKADYLTADNISKDIEISNCSFSNCIRAIGTHHTPDNINSSKRQTNINIHDCSFYNYYDSAIQFQGFQNSTVKNNYFCIDNKAITTSKQCVEVASTNNNINHYLKLSSLSKLIENGQVKYRLCFFGINSADGYILCYQDKTTKKWASEYIPNSQITSNSSGQCFYNFVPKSNAVAYSVRAYKKLGSHVARTYYSSNPGLLVSKIPYAPTQLSATAKKGSVVLKWKATTDSPSSTSMRILRKDGNGAYKCIKVISSKNSSYTDNTVVAGKKYTYMIEQTRSSNGYNYYGWHSAQKTVTAI